MIRLVVAVVVGVAVVAAALPAVEDARRDRADARLARFTERVSDAARRVTSETPVPPGVAGARRVVTLRVPRRALTLAPVHDVHVACGRRDGLVVGYRLAGTERERAVRLPVPAAVRPPVPAAVRPSRRVRATSESIRSLPARFDTPAAPTVRAAGRAFRLRLGFRLFDGTAHVTVAGGSSRKPGPPVPCSRETRVTVGPK